MQTMNFRVKYRRTRSKFVRSFDLVCKVQQFRQYIDSCAVGGLQSKHTQTKTYPSQNVPSWRQNLLK